MFAIQAIMTAEFVMAYLIGGVAQHFNNLQAQFRCSYSRSVLFFWFHSLKTPENSRNAIYLHLCGFISNEFESSLRLFPYS